MHWSSAVWGALYMVVGVWPLLDAPGFRIVTHSSSPTFMLVIGGVALMGTGFLSLHRNVLSRSELALLGLSSSLALLALDLKSLEAGGVQGLLVLHSIGEAITERRS